MNLFLDLLFPKRCAGCGKFGTYLCEGCRQSQRLHFRQICPVCERPAVDGKTHPGCKTPFSFNGATFVFAYQPPVSLVIRRLKYNFVRDLAEAVVSWTTDELKKLRFPQDSVLVPIPLHRLRHNWRGFNQAEILGREIAKEMGWSFRDDILVRSQFRKPQTEVKEAKKRRENVRGIFSINRPLNHLAMKPFILFDDVWTTGATLKEAAKVLKRNGAKFVHALAIAR